jgi:hypothetical protein
MNEDYKLTTSWGDEIRTSWAADIESAEALSEFYAEEGAQSVEITAPEGLDCE